MPANALGLLLTLRSGVTPREHQLICDTRNLTEVGSKQDKCPPHCIISPASMGVNFSSVPECHQKSPRIIFDQIPVKVAQPNGQISELSCFSSYDCPCTGPAKLQLP